MAYLEEYGWIDDLSVCVKKAGIDWKWQAIDGTVTKASLGKRYKHKSHHQTELNLILSEV
jgi:hypothetical protein